jgi:arginase/agmatinase
VVIDAHADFRMEYFGNRFNHACVTRRALEILGPGKCVSIGTRSVSSEEFTSSEWKKVRFITSREVQKGGISVALDYILSLKPKSIYFSIDMDGIDPSYAPGVGTPEPYGLKDTDVRTLINELSPLINGFDIVEMTPVYDNGNTAMLAAKLLQDFIGSREERRNI